MHKEGVFFGFRTFMSKMGQSVGAVILPSILMIGATDSAVGASGTRMTTYFALAFCAVGVALLLAYSEKKTMASLAKRNKSA
jgi:Na+/melibiose symporter-like transporter